MPKEKISIENNKKNISPLKKFLYLTGGIILLLGIILLYGYYFSEKNLKNPKPDVQSTKSNNNTTVKISGNLLSKTQKRSTETPEDPTGNTTETTAEPTASDTVTTAPSSDDEAFESQRPSMFYSFGKSLWSTCTSIASKPFNAVKYMLTPSNETKPPAYSVVRPPPTAPSKDPEPPVVYPKFFVDVIDSDNGQLLKNMIERGLVDLREMSSDGKNALHYAAFKSKPNVVKVLLENKYIPVNNVTKDEDASSALYNACFNDTKEAVEVVKLLLKHKADVNQKTKQEVSTLMMAAFSGNEEAIKLLLEHGAKVNEKVKEAYNISALHAAMISCKRPIIKSLIDAGADIEAVNDYNRMPIHDAAMLGCVEGLKELILTRGVKGVTKNTRSPSRSAKKCAPGLEKSCRFGATPLHYAVEGKQIKAVEFLFLIQVDRTIRDEDNTLPIDIRYNGTSEITNYFHDREYWENGNGKYYQQDVEGLMRYCETLPKEDSLDYFYHLNRYYLHKHSNPVPKPSNNMKIIKLTETELEFLKKNVTGMENRTINDGTGNELFTEFFLLRRRNKVPNLVNFSPGLSKNFMKNLESHFITIQF